MDASEEPHLPPSVRRRYVLDGEQLVVAIHQHPVVVAEPVLTAIAILVLVILVDANVSAGLGGVVNVLWWVWFAAVARAVWMVFEWRQQWVVATNKRLMLTYGFIVRKVAMMPLTKVTDMSYHRTIMGRIFGWGTFVMESAGQQQALSEIRFVPNPDHNYRALCAEIFAVEDRERVTAVDDDVDEAHAWPDEHDDDPYRGVVQVEPGPMPWRSAVASTTSEVLSPIEARKPRPVSTRAAIATTTVPPGCWKCIGQAPGLSPRTKPAVWYLACRVRPLPQAA